MFSLLMPMFLWGAAAIAVPLALHLMQQRRTVRIPFSTLRFLKLAQRHSSRRLRVENLLLLILRALLIAILALAFAMPMLRTTGFGGVLGNARRDVAIIIDGSYSMRYDMGRKTAWDRASEAALALIEGLSEGDRVCIFRATDVVEPVIEQLTQDREFAAAQLGALDPGTGTSRLLPALAAASATLKGEKRRREREIHVISDGQALAWSQGEFDPEALPKRTAFFITLTGATAPENTMTAGVTLTPSLIMDTMASRVQARIAAGGAAGEGAVVVHVDDEEVARRSYSPREAGAGKIVFTLPRLSPGIHAARVETQADNLDFDNAFYFLIDVRDELPVLCVGGEDDVQYLTKALSVSLTRDAIINVQRIDPRDVGGENLYDYQCVFYCNALPLPAQAVLQAEDYVGDGGTVVFFPGEGGLPGDYEPWSSLLPPNVRVVENPVNHRRAMLRWQDLRHPMFRTLVPGEETAPVLMIRRRLEWKTGPSPETPLIMAGTEHPFLQERIFGDGRVLIFAVPCDRSWSNLPLSPYYLPLVHQAVQYAAGVAGSDAFDWTTRSMILREALAGDGALLNDPAGKNVPIRATIDEGRTVRTAEDLLTPGIYLRSGPAGGGYTPALALNAERAESDLTPLPEDNLPKVLGVSGIRVARTLQDLTRLIEEHRIGRTLGEGFLWLALFVALVEVVFANYKAHSAPALSSALDAEASGRIRTGAVAETTAAPRGILGNLREAGVQAWQRLSGNMRRGSRS